MEGQSQSYRDLRILVGWLRLPVSFGRWLVHRLAKTPAN
jgi:hypothetical protein